MFDRYTLRNLHLISTPSDLLERVDRARQGEPAKLLAPRYDIAPSQRVPIADRDADGALSMHSSMWDFRPYWLAAGRRARSMPAPIPRR